MSKFRCSVLVVDDEPYILTTLAALLKPEFQVYTADSGESAQACFAQHEIHVVLSDQRMPKMSGVQLLEWVRQNYPKTIRLLFTGFAELEDAVEAINRGKIFSFLLKPWRPDELLETMRNASRSFLLERSHEQMLQELVRLNEELRTLNQDLENRVADRTRALEEANHELEHKNKMLEKLALTDPLTGLPNRRAIDRLAEREIRRRERYGSSLGLAIIDVDHFKSINDRFLLPGGDKVLTDLAKVLTGSLRNVDIIGRIGGEEFLVLAPETSMEGLTVLGERIRRSVEEAVFTFKGQLVPVRVSIGWAVADVGATADYEVMKHLAAKALAEAKQTGRNRCIYYPVPTQKAEPIPFEEAG